jgi:hypothetical protein
MQAESARLRKRITENEETMRQKIINIDALYDGLIALKRDNDTCAERIRILSEKKAELARTERVSVNVIDDDTSEETIMSIRPNDKVVVIAALFDGKDVYINDVRITQSDFMKPILEFLSDGKRQTITTCDPTIIHMSVSMEHFLTDEIARVDKTKPLSTLIPQLQRTLPGRHHFSDTIQYQGKFIATKHRSDITIAEAFPTTDYAIKIAVSMSMDHHAVFG